jgi:tRNA(Arg) A34 adenosine deaminase TadA
MRYSASVKLQNMKPEKLFMLEAIRLSEQGMNTNEGGPFGAVIVKNGLIIAKGNNKVTSANDPTAHAEIVAIREACQKPGTFNLSGCEIYCSCEPCPMCLSAIYWARIGVVYYANTSKDAAHIGFDDSLLYEEIAKPSENRKIIMKQIGRTEAIRVFHKWTTKIDKVEY